MSSFFTQNQLWDPFTDQEDHNFTQTGLPTAHLHLWLTSQPGFVYVWFVWVKLRVQFSEVKN